MNRARLADVLRVRRLQERSARGHLAVRNGEHRAAVATEARMWSDLDRNGAELARGGAMGSLQAMRSAGTLAAEAQHVVTEAAADAVTEAGAAWGEAARRVEALERLGERLAISEAEELDRAERAEHDDLTLARRRIAAADGGVPQ